MYNYVIIFITYICMHTYAHMCAYIINTYMQNWNEIEIANTVSRVGELNTVTAYYIAIFGISKCFHLKVKKKLEETCDLKCKIVTLVMPMQQNGNYIYIKRN